MELWRRIEDEELQNQASSPLTDTSAYNSVNSPSLTRDSSSTFTYVGTTTPPTKQTSEQTAWNRILLSDVRYTPTQLAQIFPDRRVGYYSGDRTTNDNRDTGSSEYEGADYGPVIKIGSDLQNLLAASNGTKKITQQVANNNNLPGNNLTIGEKNNQGWVVKDMGPTTHNATQTGGKVSVTRIVYSRPPALAAWDAGGRKGQIPYINETTGQWTTSKPRRY